MKPADPAQSELSKANVFFLRCFKLGVTIAIVGMLSLLPLVMGHAKFDYINISIGVTIVGVGMSAVFLIWRDE